MKKFLIYVLATITGIILVSLLFFFVMMASLSIMVASGSKSVSLTDNSILVLKTGMPIPDRTNPNPFAGFDFVDMTITPSPGLNDILRNIDKAANDKKIKGILIDNGAITSGWGTTEEIRSALMQFRENSGKFVIAYSEYLLPQESYFMSTAADKIFLNPSSTLDFKGLSGEVMFYKNALEKLGVEVQITRHGKFKGAVEPYILDKLSKENREQIKDYVSSIWDHAVNMIAESRGMTTEKVNILADKLTGYKADDALESGLVDGLIYRDQLIDTLKILSGLDTKDKITMIPMYKYTKVPDPKKVYTTKTRIAVIYASGTISMGKGNENNIGSEKYAEVIRKERKDSTVKAIVLRVNSPGGSAIASDIIWRELNLSAKVKPVVISMGNYAASGGYYISAPATRIYADPTTISGSIGVFGLIPNTKKLMEQKLGINTETVNTNENSDFPSFLRPMNTYEKQVMQACIEKTYYEFVSKVAAGRKMTFEPVDSIAQGRVWSGIKAMRLGLVDSIGGLKDAIKGAAELAGIETFSIRELPAIEDPYMKLLNQLGAEIKNGLLKKELGKSFRFYKELSELSELSGIQARLPYFIEIN